MDRPAAVEQIKLAVARTLGREVPELTVDTELLGELNLDSTTLLDMLMDLEDSLGFQADVDELDPSALESVGSLADYIVRVTAAA